MLTTTAFAVNPKQYLGGRNIPIHITADKMVAFDKKGIYIFEGHVVAVRGDVTLKSDNMTVYKNLKNGQIERVVCVGHVIITKQDKRAFGDKAIYNALNDSVKLIGNARVISGKNNISADLIVYYLDKDYVVSQAEGKKKRVEVTIYPNEKVKGVKK
jgi:lipopolysaccharide export system protein LptA